MEVVVGIVSQSYPNHDQHGEVDATSRGKPDGSSYLQSRLVWGCTGLRVLHSKTTIAFTELRRQGYCGKPTDVLYFPFAGPCSWAGGACPYGHVHARRVMEGSRHPRPLARVTGALRTAAAFPAFIKERATPWL